MKFLRRIILVGAMGLLVACGKTSTNEKNTEANSRPDKDYIDSIVWGASNGDTANFTKEFKRVTEQHGELPPVWWDLQFYHMNYPYNGGDIDCGELAGISIAEIIDGADSDCVLAMVTYALRYEYGNVEENKSVVKLQFEDGAWRIDDFGFPSDWDLQSEGEYRYIKKDWSNLIEEVNNDIVERYDEILENFRQQADYDPTSYNYPELARKLNDYIEKYDIEIKRHAK